MKNIIALILLLVLTPFAIYNFIKANEAEKAIIAAEMCRKESEQLRKQSVKLAEAALESAAEARLQMQRAEDAAAMAREAEADAHKALMECKSR